MELTSHQIAAVNQNSSNEEIFGTVIFKPLYSLLGRLGSLCEEACLDLHALGGFEEV